MDWTLSELDLAVKIAAGTAVVGTVSTTTNNQLTTNIVRP